MSTDTPGQLQMPIYFKGQQLDKLSMICQAALDCENEEERKTLKGLVVVLGPYILENLGYFAGYYSEEDAKVILKTFGTHHPIFGNDWPDKKMSAGDAYKLGLKLGTEIKRRPRL